MDPDTCPDCAADLQQVGVRENGLVSYEEYQTWNPEEELYEASTGDQVHYGERSYVSYRSGRCQAELGFTV